jgi:hypothetical protein
VGHSGVRVEYRWHKGIASREVPRSELVWTPSREVPKSQDLWGRVAEHKVGPQAKGWTRVEFSHLGDSWTRRVKTRRFNRRGREVARLREALTLSLAHDFMW